MSAVRSLLEIVVDIKNSRAAASELKDVGQASQTAGGQAEKAGGSWKRMAARLAGVAAGAIAVKKGFNFLKGAAGDAITLAKSTAQLTRATGMNTQGASAWVSIAKQRGIETKQLNTAFTAFSKKVTAAQAGSKSAIKAFEGLGISQDLLASTGGDYQAQLDLLAEGLRTLPAGAEKSALTVQLLGKSGQQLLPILADGAEGLREQRKEMRDAGLTMDKQGIEKTLELAKTQRELNTRMQGVKTTIGQALIPILLMAAKAILPLAQWFSRLIRHVTKLASRAVLPALQKAWKDLQPTLDKLRREVLPVLVRLLRSTWDFAVRLAKTALPILRNAFKTVVPWLVKAVKWLGPDGLLTILGGLVAAGMVAKIVSFGKAAHTAIIGIVTAFKAGGVAGLVAGGWPVIIIGAIIALGVALVIAYRKCKWFRDFVDAAFRVIKGVISTVVNWVKSNWPLLFRILIGPIGNAVLLIVQNFGKIRAGITSAKDWVLARVGDIVSFVKGIPGRLAGLAPFAAVRTAITSAKNWVRDRVTDIVGFFTRLPGRVGSALGGLFDKFTKPFKDAVGWIERRIQDLVNAYYSLPFTGQNPADLAKQRRESERQYAPMRKALGKNVTSAKAQAQFFAQGTGGRSTFVAPAPTSRQFGGIASGLALVGERGPEILSIAGRGRITPINPAPVAPVLAAAPAGGDRDIHVHVEVGEREIGHAVARDLSRRRGQR